MNNFEETGLFRTLSINEAQDINGGIAPIIILGVAISGKTVAAVAATATFLAGCYVGYEQNK